MRAALVQAMARDPAGRFDTAQAFGNALKNSVATLGGPSNLPDLAKMLFTDFGDEMASRDEILKAADDPTAAPISIGPKPPPIPTTPRPPPIPQSTSGEMHQSTTPARGRLGSSVEGIPSMIVQSGSTKISAPDLEAVLDLSSNMGDDAWMAEGGTDLLSAHRWKSLLKLGIALLAAAVVAGGIIWFVTRTGSEAPMNTVQAPPADAAIRKPIVDIPIDAPDNKDDIIALSHFGFFSINASAKTTIYIDDKVLGDTPITRVPYKPGPHVVKAVGPKGKSKIIKIAIVAGRDDDEGTITW
jgi:hypothetical protein